MSNHEQNLERAKGTEDELLSIKLICYFSVRVVKNKFFPKKERKNLFFSLQIHQKKELLGLRVQPHFADRKANETRITKH